MPSKATKQRNARQIPALSPAGTIRAYHRMIRQLVVLRRRVNDRIPDWRKAMAAGEGWSQQTDELRLDFECYITVLARFFRLCKTITRLPEFGDEPIVREIRAIRDRIVEHGFDDDSGQGDRGFICGEHGPMLVMDGGIQCLSMAQIDDGVNDLLERHRLKTDQIAFSHFSPLTGIDEFRAELGFPPRKDSDHPQHIAMLLRPPK